eukprot:187714-Prorocentrum_minimum.AAC.5
MTTLKGSQRLPSPRGRPPRCRPGLGQAARPLGLERRIRRPQFLVPRSRGELHPYVHVATPGRTAASRSTTESIKTTACLSVGRS